MKTKGVALVLGGSGFLGSHVADALVREGYSVRVFDRTKSSYLSTNQEMIIGDIQDAAAVMKAAKGCEVVYNFASVADIGEARKQPSETVTVNIQGNLNALDAARAAGAKRYVLASTVYVYSEAGSFYRASKQAAEKYVEVYGSEFGLNYTILRYGSLYGRRAPAWNGIRKLLESAMKTNILSYVGNESAMREYIHVEDAARLSVQILGSEYENQHIIVTGPERMAVKSFLQMIAEMLPNEVKIEFRNEAGEIHYVMSPYSFNPKVGRKLTAPYHVDLGQGILDCLAELKESMPDA